MDWNFRDRHGSNGNPVNRSIRVNCQKLIWYSLLPLTAGEFPTWASISAMANSCTHPAAAAKSASLPCQTNTINPVTWEPERICEKVGFDGYFRLDFLVLYAGCVDDWIRSGWLVNSLISWKREKGTISLLPPNSDLKPQTAKGFHLSFFTSNL